MRVNMRQFRGNRSNRYRDMAIFQFFKMAAAAILDFSNFKFLRLDSSRGSKCVAVPKLVEIDRNAAEICDFRFSKMAAVLHLGFVMCVFIPPTKGF